MSNGWGYISSVSDEDFQEAMADMEKAIAEKDTPEEWARFTGKSLLFVAKLAASQLGAGPVIELATKLFANEESILKVIEMVTGDIDDA